MTRRPSLDSPHRGVHNYQGGTVAIISRQAQLEDSVTQLDSKVQLGSAPQKASKPSVQGQTNHVLHLMLLS